MAGSPTNCQSQKIDIISMGGSPTNSQVLLPASSTNNDQESQNRGFIKVSSPRKSRKIDGDKINIKVVIVGDGAVGKTVLLGTYVRVAFWDTCGQDDFDRLRALSYPDADAVIIAFAANDPASLDNVYGSWTSEVRHHLPNVPIFLVATKIDKRTDARNDARIEVVTYEDGSAVAKNIKATGYLECSAKTGGGLDNVYEHVIRAGVLYNLTVAFSVSVTIILWTNRKQRAAKKQKHLTRILVCLARFFATPRCNAFLSSVYVQIQESSSPVHANDPPSPNIY
ncbi:7486_t:CDS:2 [Paraglomus occultum]|uniref:7486_t:CDS:1 n=1 Tax=Paraglomus occultum TaxID=144539 RepID=A0A9N8ZZI8_9GLOM|nr:7486_t:CDS:2 [Paraglomus occultum]